MAGKMPCQYFQLGTCKRGNACAYPHVRDPSFKRKACQHHARGRCTRGKQCTYSHDAADMELLKATSGTNGLNTNGSDTTEVQFREWRYSVPTQPGKARPLAPAALSKFFKQALKLVMGEAGLMQETILLLAGEGGLLRITELVDQPLKELNAAQLSRVFELQILPFFKIITQKNVVSSVILGPRVMTICNIIYNSSGERAVSLFAAVTRHLESLNPLDLDDDGAANFLAIDALETSLAALDKIIEVNTEAQVHDGLKLLTEALALLFEHPMDESIVFAIKPAQKYLRRIERRLGLGQALPQMEKTKAVGARATFDLARDRPGELSEDGPRHDNDHVDVRQISILPTLQEIQSARTEYLPLADPREWHLGGLEGLLDRHFRLLREDTVGQLRDAAKLELERLQHPQAQHGHDSDRKRQGARTYVYEHVAISMAAFDSHNGMEFVLSFDQPPGIRGTVSKQRRDWWEGSKRLGDSALICLLSSEGSVTFLVVLPEPKKNMQSGANESLHKHWNLYEYPDRAHVIATPVKQTETLPLLLQWMGHVGKQQLSLVEFPGVLLPTFQPTLQAMQRMSDSLEVPFAELLAPVATVANPHREFDVPPPAYAQKPGFQFKLTSVTAPGATLQLGTIRGESGAVTTELTANSTLDEGQAQAVISSLSRSLALIQGPPGTGKSYTGVQLIKILLDNKSAGDLGPIICVCFTNHALDQSLERLLDEGVERIVRIGGRSKSERLADVNLREVARRLEVTKTEKSDRWELKKKIELESNEMNGILQRMGQLNTQSAVKAHLMEQYPEQHAQLFAGLDEDGFTTVNYHPEAVFETWTRQAPWGHGNPRPVEELLKLHVANMTGQERMTLHYHWMNEMLEELQNRLNHALMSYSELNEDLKKIRNELDHRVLRQADIIGITTSGLARNLDLLGRVDAKVLLAEEAGEILESHLLTGLLPSIQHAILIGDHQQLRPHVQNYDLSAESKNGAQYSLDVSLFERLVAPQDVLSQPLPYCTLGVQRRMHPSVAELIRRTLYPQLQDAPSVSTYPNVVGMRHRLFWMDHENLECEGGDAITTSRTNDYEVEMTTALVKHLVRQGVYSPQEIAVITPYLGQLRKLRNKMGGTFEIVLNDRDTDDLQQDGIEPGEDLISPDHQDRPSVGRGTLLQTLRLATVDNFQGEEAKVVIISLVRSNAKNNPGFLRTSNRINVLLSRAQHGMYIIGNANTMKNVSMWADVLNIFRSQGNLGTGLELCCPRHEETPMVVSSPDDFVRLSPEAGCSLACEKQLVCGHACVSKCHSELLHDSVYCAKTCTRPKSGCSHNCPLPCGSPCPKQCQEIVNVDVELKCGHHATSLPCYQHQDPSKVTCLVPVDSVVPGCQHPVTEPCHVDVQGAYQCIAVCGEALTCGHICQSRCYKCRARMDGTVTVVEHGQCKQPCDRNYSTCSHRCKEKCHGTEACPLCSARCETACSHSRCGKSCQEACMPCAEEHCGSEAAGCSMPCSAPCNHLPKADRCTKTLSCGCQCPSVAGEACPSLKFCQNCATEEIKSMQADMIMFESYREIDLDDDPVIVTACGHVFTLSSMDGTMDMGKHYDIDAATGEFMKLKSSSEPFSQEELKSCPTCRGSLRNIARYGRIVRRALLDESAKRLTVFANRMHQQHSKELFKVQEHLLVTLKSHFKPRQDIRLGGSVDDQLRAVRGLKTASRYRSAFIARNSLEAFVRKLRIEEQPYQRVSDLVETARRKNAKSDVAVFEFSSEELQLREHLQAISLLIRADFVILTDVISMHYQTASGTRDGGLRLDFRANREGCGILVTEAHKSRNVRQEEEGHIYWARFAAMECGTLAGISEDVAPGTMHRLEVLTAEAFDHLKKAGEICQRFVGGKVDPTQGLSEEIVEVGRMLNEGVSTSEMRMVVAAMASEFRGTGHWYRCANGHPFTVGECGMPMELARCPACAAGIGGRSHVPTEGVQRAEDIEREFGNLRV